MGSQATEISTVEHLILLDLLGAPQPRIRNYYLDTAWLFDAIASVEKRLGNSGAFVYGDEHSMAPDKWYPYFAPRTGHERNYGGIGDDHVPFLQKGVSILHLIANPFPRVWHTLKVSTFWDTVTCNAQDISHSGRCVCPSSSYDASLEHNPPRVHVRIPQSSTRRIKVTVR